ncbi:MAG: cobyrinic acid a,c-diamide synthase [Kamptonema sp. SIO1D9]|nr:cobyrinic acid a,c-diamide synthase [Kamptonema sp. SIO1D9]
MITQLKDKIAVLQEGSKADKMLERLPVEVKKWAEGLPWKERRYVLSLCHLLCAASPEMQAQFLDDYTADGLIAKILQDQDAQEKVQFYLRLFRIDTKLTGSVLRKYIRQFYIHSAQDVSRQPDKYLESALRLVVNSEEQSHVLNYILGFEIIKMMFQMSWQQHERLYRIQINQEEFYNKYIKRIQNAHRLNGIIVPKDERVFFAKRDYFVQKPEIGAKKLIELILVTFTTEAVCELGFSIGRNIKHLIFDYDYIFQRETEGIFAS